MKDEINFDRIDKDGPQTYSGKYEVRADELDRPEVANVGVIDIDVNVEKSLVAGEYIADGTARFMADLTCSRCVEPYPFANSSTFHVRFRPRPAAFSEENDEVEITNEEDLDVEFYSERAVPLRGLALEQVQLSIPMKPVCTEGCLGLCPKCGVNRSSESCQCDETVVDDRWGALRGIREELSKKKDH